MLMLNMITCQLLSVLRRCSVVVDSSMSVVLILRFFSFSMFCCVLLCFRSNFGVILVGWRAGLFAWFVFIVSSSRCHKFVCSL